MITLIPPIAIALAFASDASSDASEWPADMLWERLKEEYPERILEENLGLTRDVMTEIGWPYTHQLMIRMAHDNDMARFLEWIEAYLAVLGYTDFHHLRFVQSLMEERGLPGAFYRWGAETSKREKVLKALASNPDVPTDILVELSASGSELIRREVAKNTSTPSNVLDQLVSDTDPWVRKNLVDNPNLYFSSLERLCHDSSVEVWYNAHARRLRLNRGYE